MLSEIKTEEGGVMAVPQLEVPDVPFVERPPVAYADMPTPLPGFLYFAQQKVTWWGVYGWQNLKEIGVYYV